jgi:hypothetical protein
MSYGMESFQGERRHAFAIAMEMIEQERIRLDRIPVETYRIREYRQALEDLLRKGNSRLVKAAFDFRGSAHPPSRP